MELNVDLFSDLREAIRLYSSTFYSYSVILADFCMGEMSGFEFE
jgi:hypothetical protein